MLARRWPEEYPSFLQLQVLNPNWETLVPFFLEYSLVKRDGVNEEEGDEERRAEALLENVFWHLEHGSPSIYEIGKHVCGCKLLFGYSDFRMFDQSGIVFGFSSTRRENPLEVRFHTFRDDETFAIIATINWGVSTIFGTIPKTWDQVSGLFRSFDLPNLERFGVEYYSSSNNGDELICVRWTEEQYGETAFRLLARAS